MRKLSLIIGLFLAFSAAWAQQSPHGNDLKINCADCHTTEGWTFSQATALFDHDSTVFKLEGQHIFADCKACHTSLIFAEAKTNCVDCHTDMHNTTVGPDCARCHDAQSWLVTNITEIHQQSRFPLLGAHNTADCAACHTSPSLLEFQPLGVECIDCHRQDYQATTNPNHVQAGLSTNCFDCHRVDAFEWTSSGFNHDFFPLNKGHAITDCAACHTTGVFEPVSTDCYSCHQQDFVSATNPSHQNQGFSTSCTECHTTEPNWKPAKFDIHDNFYFPIYSGEHRGEWESCTDCHKQPENYSVFSCVDCHEHNKNEMDNKHREINGYSYNSMACFACHPLGKEEGAFNHNTTNFPLKGAHIQADCLSCHTEIFSGTSTDCRSCHTNNYNQAVNPNHLTAGISTECSGCHTEEDWKPSQFDHTVTTGFALTNGHSGRQCADCHLGNTTSASQECISCHQQNYNEAKNHLAQNFPFDCLQCHNTSNWEEATFDHNATSFALTGAHVATECSACHTLGYAGTSSQCSACHTDNYNQALNPGHTAAGISVQCETCHTTTTWIPSQFDHTVTTGFALTNGHSGRQCADCHLGNTTSASQECISCHQQNYNEAKNHLAQNFPFDCLQCHNTSNWEEATFDHNATSFALTGAHVATECSACHTSGYAGTSSQCSACHTDNYNQTANPNHTSLGLSNQCNECHTTTPDWQPALFPVHNDFYSLNGAHIAVADNCYLCHAGNYTNIANTCAGCHSADYNSTTDPPHATAKFPTDCESCHTETAWSPSTFNHDAQYFPIYSGEHRGEWNSCADCHTEPTNYSVFSCILCHEHNKTEMDNKHNEVTGYVYNSVNCLACHPTGTTDD